jgi:hypothetical protein
MSAPSWQRRLVRSSLHQLPLDVGCRPHARVQRPREPCIEQGLFTPRYGSGNHHALTFISAPVARHASGCWGVHGQWVSLIATSSLAVVGTFRPKRRSLVLLFSGLVRPRPRTDARSVAPLPVPVNSATSASAKRGSSNVYEWLCKQGSLFEACLVGLVRNKYR